MRKTGRVDYLQRCTEEAVSFAGRQGLDVMYVTEDTTRSDPDTLRQTLHDRDPCRRRSHLHRGHGRARDAGRRARRRSFRANG